MCFNPTWSAGSFLLLFATATATAIARMDWRIPATLFFFSTKEAIQFFLYPELHACSQVNEFLTALAWIHISFHPFFVLLFIQAFSRRPNLYTIPIRMALVFAILNILRLHPSTMNDPCVPTENPVGLCKTNTCSYPGVYHLAYGFKLQSGDRGALTPNMFAYLLLMIGVPLLIGDWTITTANLFLILISYGFFHSNNLGEGSAIWCFFASGAAFFALGSLLTGRRYYP